MKIFLLPLLLSGSALLLLFTIAWLIQLCTKNGAVADVAWGLAFPLSTLIYFIDHKFFAVRQYAILVLVSLWGLRLALYLYGRAAGKPEDARYTTLRKKWGRHHNLYMLRFYYVQALLAWVLSVPFALIMDNNADHIHAVEIFGFAVWFVGIVGESLADYQLKRFKSSSANKGKVCNEGLWYYSRHPNYFFEWAIWIGYFLLAVTSPLGWFSILSPVLMLYFLLKVTGIPYTEAHMLETKGQAFSDYKRSTSPFIPLPKRKPR